MMGTKQESKFYDEHDLLRCRNMYSYMCRAGTKKRIKKRMSRRRRRESLVVKRRFLDEIIS